MNQAKRPRLLDLFCGAGGAGYGYAQAGFDVTGVDTRPQPRYPFPFIQTDALSVDLVGYDVIHASPPCQHYSVMNGPWQRDHPDLLGAVRDRLRGQLYVIENIPQAPLHNARVLCGSMFGLPIRRHRHFECSIPLVAPMACKHARLDRPGLAFGAGSWNESAYRAAMCVPWMSTREMRQAIPPVYTLYVGQQLLLFLSCCQRR